MKEQSCTSTSQQRALQKKHLTNPILRAARRPASTSWRTRNSRPPEIIQCCSSGHISERTTIIEPSQPRQAINDEKVSELSNSQMQIDRKVEDIPRSPQMQDSDEISA